MLGKEVMKWLSQQFLTKSTNRSRRKEKGVSQQFLTNPSTSRLYAAISSRDNASIFFENALSWRRREIS